MGFVIEASIQYNVDLPEAHNYYPGQRSASMYSQPQWRRTDAFLFAIRSMRLPFRTRRRASVRRDEHATGLCQTVPWYRAMRLQPEHYVRRLLCASTPSNPNFSSTTCGTILFNAAAIPSVDSDFNLIYYIHNETFFTSPLSQFLEIVLLEANSSISFTASSFPRHTKMNTQESNRILLRNGPLPPTC